TLDHSFGTGLSTERKPDSALENHECTYAETSRTFTLRLFADHQAAALHMAGRQATCLLRCSQYRALCFRGRHWHGPGTQRHADHTQLGMARLRQPDRELAPF